MPELARLVRTLDCGKEAIHGGALKKFIGIGLGVWALVFVPAAGCGGSTDGGGGAAAGTGGVAGEAGAGGVGGAAGMGGSGGSEASVEGLWTGSGDTGPGAPWEICFHLNADGTALTKAVESAKDCQAFSLEIAFAQCDGFLSYAPDIPVVDGAFRLRDPRGYFDISGTFDGLTASGEGSILVGQELCSGNWVATALE